MAVLDWTTLANVKAAGNFATSTVAATDADLSSLITAVSAFLEQQINRPVKVQAQVERRKAPRKERFAILGGPVVSITQVRYSDSGLFSRDAVTVPSSSYELEPGNEGLIIPDYASASGWLEVSYSGGMAADTAAFRAAYPDLERAAIQQVIYTWSRRATLGRTSTDIGNGSTQWVGDLDLLANVVAIISPYAHKWAIG